MVETNSKRYTLDTNDIEELAKLFDLLQKFDVQDKKEEAEKRDPVKD